MWNAKYLRLREISLSFQEPINRADVAKCIWIISLKGQTIK